MAQILVRVAAGQKAFEALQKNRVLNSWNGCMNERILEFVRIDLNPMLGDYDCQLEYFGGQTEVRLGDGTVLDLSRFEPKPPPTDRAFEEMMMREILKSLNVPQFPEGYEL